MSNENLNIVEHLECLLELNKSIHQKIQSSTLFKSIENYIIKNPKNIFIPHPENHEIPCYKGSGRSIRLKDAGLWGIEIEDNKIKPRSCFWIKISVEFKEIDLYTDFAVQKHKEITIPLDLSTNFTKEKFDYWIAELEEKNNKHIYENETKLLLELIAKYPELALKKAKIYE